MKFGEHMTVLYALRDFGELTTSEIGRLTGFELWTLNAHLNRNVRRNRVEKIILPLPHFNGEKLMWRLSPALLG